MLLHSALPRVTSCQIYPFYLSHQSQTRFRRSRKRKRSYEVPEEPHYMYDDLVLALFQKRGDIHRIVEPNFIAPSSRTDCDSLIVDEQFVARVGGETDQDFG